MREIVSFNKEIPFKTKIYKIASISLEHTLKKKEENIIDGNFILSGTYKMTETTNLEEAFNYKIPANIIIDNKYDTNELEVDIDNFTYEVIDEEILKVFIDIKLDNLNLKEEIIDKKEVKTEDYIEKIEEINLEEDPLEELEKLEREIDKQIEEDRKKEEQEKELSRNNEDLIKEEPQKKDEEIEILDFSDSNSQREENLFKEIETKKDFEIPSNKVMNQNTQKEALKQTEKEENIMQDQNVESIFMSFDNAQETYSTYRVYIVRENDNIETILNKYKISKEQLEEYNNLQEVRIGTKIIIPNIKENE